MKEPCPPPEPLLGNTRVCDLSRALLYDHFRKVATKEGARKGLIVLNMCLDHAVLLGHIEINSARLPQARHVRGHPCRRPVNAG